MGPWGSSWIYHMVSHNTYLGTMLNHGWIGGFAYLTPCLAHALRRVPSVAGAHAVATFLIPTYLAFVALTLENWVDTDLAPLLPSSGADLGTGSGTQGDPAKALAPS